MLDGYEGGGCHDAAQVEGEELPQALPQAVSANASSITTGGPCFWTHVGFGLAGWLSQLPLSAGQAEILDKHERDVIPGPRELLAAPSGRLQTIAFDLFSLQSVYIGI
jgi:hypothetical protein